MPLNRVDFTIQDINTTTNRLSVDFNHGKCLGVMHRPCELTDRERNRLKLCWIE